MEIRIKIKPMVLESTKKKNPRFNGGLTWNHSTYGSGWHLFGKAIFIAVIYEKRRKKVVQIGKDKRGKTESKVIKPAHWVIRYYEIPFETLKIAGLKLKQGHRTFKLEKA